MGIKMGTYPFSGTYPFFDFIREQGVLWQDQHVAAQL